MTPEIVIAKLQQMSKLQKANPFASKTGIGIDSLALSLNVPVKDLMTHLSVLEFQGKVELTPANKAKGYNDGIEKGKVSLVEQQA
jgi:hypothetical protein